MTTCASGYRHSLFLDSLGCVWACGNKQSGALGLGNPKTKPTIQVIPAKINNLPPIVSVSAGFQFSLFLDENGNVWSCGNNEYGELGLGDKSQRSVPEKIKNLPPIVSILALFKASLFLDSEGSVWSCGTNLYGQLGLGDTIHRNKAEKIQGLPKIEAIAGGPAHSLFLDCEGSVWSCGLNQWGNLGLGDEACACEEKDDEVTVSPHITKPEKIQGLPKIKSVAGGGGDLSMFVDEQDDVWVCGSNYRGELGIDGRPQINSPLKNENLSRMGIVAVAGGNGQYSVFLDNEGNIFTCGANDCGQLGLGDTQERRTPTKVNNIPPISCISACSTAGAYLNVVDGEGRVWGCGKNDLGQLGLGDTKDRREFERIASLPVLKQSGNGRGAH